MIQPLRIDIVIEREGFRLAVADAVSANISRARIMTVLHVRHGGANQLDLTNLHQRVVTAILGDIQAVGLVGECVSGVERFAFEALIERLTHKLTQ